jgi:redox-sensitive bicupin YhaK (pirin superfamily)
VGQLAVIAEDDRAALPGSESAGHSGDQGRRRNARARRLREILGKTGPVDGIAADPIYLDVSVPPGRRKTLPVEITRHAFAYVFAGAGKFCNASEPLEVPTEPVSWADTNPPAEADNRSLVLFDRGDELMVQAGDDGIRFLLVSGKPLEEPVAWYGPIVMNTQEQLRQAFSELDKGTFLKPPRAAKGGS